MERSGGAFKATELSTVQKLKMQLSDMPLFVHYARVYWSPYAFIGGVSAIALTGSGLYRVLLYSQTLKAIADGALVVGGGALIQKALVRMAIGLPLLMGMSVLGERLASRSSSRVANDVRADLFPTSLDRCAHLQELPPSFYKDARVSDLGLQGSTLKRTLLNRYGTD